MVKFVRITDKDYEQYRQSYSKIKFSYDVKNQAETINSRCHTYYMNALILEEPTFLEVLKKSEIEMYFIKDDEDKIIGIIVVEIAGNFCYLDMFAMFEKDRGLGSKAFGLLKKLLESKNVEIIRLTCPFAGAQVFWKKQGFYLVPNKGSMYEMSIFQ